MQNINWKPAFHHGAMAVLVIIKPKHDKFIQNFLLIDYLTSANCLHISKDVVLQLDVTYCVYRVPFGDDTRYSNSAVNLSNRALTFIFN